MKILLAFVLFSPMALAQGIGGTAGFGGTGGFGASTPPSIAFVQQCAAPDTGPVTTRVCTVGSNFTTGNTIYVGYTNSTNFSISSVAGTGLTCAAVANTIANNGTSRHSEIYKCTVGASPGNALTVTVSGTIVSSNTNAVVAAEFSGITADITCATCGATGSSTTPTTASITPTAAQTAVLFACSRIGAAPSGIGGSPANGFIVLTPTATNIRDLFAYIIVTNTSGSYSTNWTISTGTWAASIAGSTH